MHLLLSTLGLSCLLLSLPASLPFSLAQSPAAENSLAVLQPASNASLAAEDASPDYVAALSSLAEQDDDAFGNQPVATRALNEPRQVGELDSAGTQQLQGDYSDSFRPLSSSTSFSLSSSSLPPKPHNFPFLPTAHSLQRSLRADQSLARSLASEQAQQQQPTKVGPQFIKEPPSFIHYLNSSDLVVPCAASGNPAPTIVSIAARSREISRLT